MSEKLIEIENIFKESIEKYKIVKTELNKLSREIEKVYNSDDDSIIAMDLDLLYELEDDYFAKVIEATILYSQIQTLFERIGHTEEYIFVMNKISKEIQALEPMEAYFYFDYQEKKEEKGDE